MQFIQKKSLGWLLTFFCTVSVGIFPLVYKKLADASVNFWQVIVWLFLFSFLFNFLFYIFSTFIHFKKNNPKKQFSKMKLDKKFIFFILLLALCTILGNLLFLFSIQQISAGIAQLTQRTEIIFVLYLSWFFLKEKVSFKVNIAVLVIFLGIAILKWDSANISQFITGLFPIFLAILSGFFFACMQLLIQEAVKKFTPAFINIWRLGVTLCLLFVLLFIFLPNLQSIFNPNSSLLLWAAIAAFLGPFMARLFYSYACQILPVSKIVLLTPLAAIFTLFFQWILLGIGASLIEITGSAIVLVGIYTAIKYK